MRIGPLNLLEEINIKPGDILLCYSADMQEERPGRWSGYSHAAICYEPGKILESAGNGVRYTAVQNLLEEYGHIAILRNTWAWDFVRCQQLKEFAKKVIGTPFNLEGLKQYELNRTVSISSQLERINKYFENPNKSPPFSSGKLFCSELIVTCFIYVGVIGNTAKPAFPPEIFLPQDLADDALFGFFIGYLLPYESYQIPSNDYFRGYAEDDAFMREVRGKF